MDYERIETAALLTIMICQSSCQSRVVSSCQNKKKIMVTTQDITGGNLLTQKDQFLTQEQVMQLAARMLSGPDANMEIDLPKPAIVKPRKMWTGNKTAKQVVSR